MIELAEKARQDAAAAAERRDSGACQLKVVKFRPEGVIPKRATSGAAGMDISSAMNCVVPAKGKAIVDTAISIAPANGVYGRIAPRSGLAAKHMIDVGAGVIDSDYRGEIKVVLFNHGLEDFKITAGDRIAQLILEKISMLNAYTLSDVYMIFSLMEGEMWTPYAPLQTRDISSENVISSESDINHSNLIFDTIEEEPEISDPD
jgi:deoxyuridine 5'-triphosphate nucleotidohydrolase